MKYTHQTTRVNAPGFQEPKDVCVITVVAMKYLQPVQGLGFPPGRLGFPPGVMRQHLHVIEDRPTDTLSAGPVLATSLAMVLVYLFVRHVVHLKLDVKKRCKTISGPCRN